MNAEEARNLMNKSQEQAYGYDDVMERVEEAARSGLNQCYVYQRIPDLVRVRLINEGYRFVSEHFDQRDGLTITLAW